MSAACDHGQLLLAIESSCDETAAAVIDRRLRILSNVVSSQVDLHAEFGGVVPEIASRAHLVNILPVLERALSAAAGSLEAITAVAVVTEPGLVGSLLVGLTAAKALQSHIVRQLKVKRLTEWRIKLRQSWVGNRKDIFA